MRGALLAARAAGHPHVTVDGTLIVTDRYRAPGPTPGVDPWWSGKHAAHGGNVQVLAAPDGWPLWTSSMPPGREQDTTALRAHPEALPLLGEWTDAQHAALANLGYEGEDGVLTTPVKRIAGHALTADQRTLNALHAGTRAPPNAETRCSRRRSRRCAESASTPGASAPSPLPPSSCSTISTTARHDQYAGRAVTGNGSMCRSGRSHVGKRASAEGP